MKRSEMMAWTGLVGLLAIGLVLLSGGVMYNTTPFWAGTMLAFGQALVVGLAAWGLSLARQRADLRELPALRQGGGFRMTLGEEGMGAAGPREEEPAAEAKTLDTSFQRMVVAVSAVLLLTGAVVTSYLIYNTFAWFRDNSDQPFPIAGTFANPRVLDELALVIGLGAAGGYVLLYWLTRRGSEEPGGDAVSSNFTLGLGAMLALGIATVLGYFNVARAAEVAGVIMAALMALQGIELLVNSLRSYTAIEELDEEGIDLQELPLAPMLSSVWLSGLKLLFEQSFGLARREERGVFSRMMPRAIGAVLVIAILISCLRVVQPGTVAVLERLGYAEITLGQNGDKELAPSSVLNPGLHLTFPWPIDQLVVIPTQQMQTTTVGTELHAPVIAGSKLKLDFQFWTWPPRSVKETVSSEDEFVTGDPNGGELLETYVVVLWRVADPSKFYTGLSHSTFADRSKGPATFMPIYDALVQSCASFAVTRTFAIHNLNELMLSDRREAELHCKTILQDKLDEAHSGIEVADLSITDMHPPIGKGRQTDPAHPTKLLLGPADAFENVMSMQQRREALKNQGLTIQTRTVNLAKGDAAAMVSGAETYKARTIAQAQGEAARMQAIMAGTQSLSAQDQKVTTDFYERQAMYRAFQDVFGPVNKILVDPRVKDLTLWQQSENGATPLPPIRPPG